MSTEANLTHYFKFHILYHLKRRGKKQNFTKLTCKDCMLFFPTRSYTCIYCVEVSKILISDASGVKTMTIINYHAFAPRKIICKISSGCGDGWMRRWFSHHWFRKWLVVCLDQSHFMKQCWYMVCWNISNNILGNVNQNDKKNNIMNIFKKICMVVCRLENSCRTIRRGTNIVFRRPIRPVIPCNKCNDIHAVLANQLCNHLWPLLLTWLNFNPSMDM